MKFKVLYKHQLLSQFGSKEIEATSEKEALRKFAAIFPEYIEAYAVEQVK